ncbi:AAA family ATPase [Streptomyces sp. NPDC002248]
MMRAEAILRVISPAWGKNRGYVFFPYIDRKKQEETGLRRSGYNETKAFRWPRDRDKILEHIDAHRDKDLYWCPVVFEYPERKTEYAMEEYALWADLDEVDPRQIDVDYQPTSAWESSPGRYQALWVIKNGNFLGASWPGRENQRLTYYLGADKSGWDTTQLLRLPGWDNHKTEYKVKGKPAPGKLLWANRGVYQTDDFEDLPEVEGALETAQITEVLEREITSLDRSVVIDKIKLKLNQRARDILYARSATGDLSDSLWYLMRCLADAGCSVAEIVAVVKSTPWNKFDGRADEWKRLITEATKAIAQRSEEVTEALEEEQAPKAKPQRLAGFLADVKKPEWLVRDIAPKGTVGFIAGEPKSFKSWFALDLALSVATGARFLDQFDIVQPGPVLYIQEEDSAITVKDRTRKIWKGKAVDKIRMTEGGELEWHPGNEAEFDPDIGIYIQEGFVLSEGHWQEWLDYTLSEGLDGKPYVLVIIDTLMNVAGDVEENKAQQMTTRIYKPLKILARKHEVAVRLVHHMVKGKENDNRRGGQKMLGSVANHAWSEDSLYLSRSDKGVRMDVESKTVPESTHRIINLDNHEWSPLFEVGSTDKAEVVATAKKPPRRTTARGQTRDLILDRLSEPGPWSTQGLANAVGMSYNTIYRRLRDLEAEHRVSRDGKRWVLPKIASIS